MVCVSNCLSTVKYLEKATPIFLEMGLTDAHAQLVHMASKRVQLGSGF